MIFSIWISRYVKPFTLPLLSLSQPPLSFDPFSFYPSVIQLSAHSKKKYPPSPFYQIILPLSLSYILMYYTSCPGLNPPPFSILLTFLYLCLSHFIHLLLHSPYHHHPRLLLSLIVFVSYLWLSYILEGAFIKNDKAILFSSWQRKATLFFHTFSSWLVLLHNRFWGSKSLQQSNTLTAHCH